MNNKYFDEIRKKREKAAEKTAKAQEFVRSKEAEVSELKERMVRSADELDAEAYINLMKLVAEKEQELNGLKDIANRTKDLSGYSDHDVMAAFAKFCSEYNPKIAKKIKAYNEKKKELISSYEEMAKLQKEAILLREEFKGYIINKSNRLELLTIIPNWTRSLSRVFYGSGAFGEAEGEELSYPDGIMKDREMCEFCSNVGSRYQNL